VTQGASYSAAGVKEGQILAGKYRIDRILGEGGMGVVVSAHHIHLDEQVAIKFLLPEALGNPEAVARFAREARAAVKIKSQHVARVIDVGTLETGAPYMVMEHLQGSDLSTWLTQKGALAVEQAVEFILQAGEAVAEAHGLGIVHRDLKPANLFVVRGADGLYSVKVLDFGISKVARADGAPDMAMTKTTAVMGSPLYMSPEQMTSSRNVDARTDIWALGIVLYELLSGSLPFTGETLPEVCVKIATYPPAPLRSLRPEVPAGVEAAIARCLEKDPKRRYANVAELAAALVEFGPKRAKASAERILRVIQNAGLATSDVAIPPSARPADRKPESRQTSPGAGGDDAPAGIRTMAGWGVTDAGVPSSRKAFIGVAVGLALLATVPVVLLARRSSDADSSRASAGSVSTPPSADPAASNLAPAPSAVHLAETAAADVLGAGPTRSAPTREPPASETRVHAASSAELPVHPAGAAEMPARAAAATTSSAKPISAAAPTGPVTTAPAAGHDCNPPFFFDKAGIKRPKPECL
jgi:serine/threonine-protein kinase